MGVYHERSGEPCVTASRARTTQVRAGESQRWIEGMLRSPTVLPLIYVRPVPTYMPKGGLILRAKTRNVSDQMTFLMVYFQAILAPENLF